MGKWFEKFLELLKDILLWPCYLIFFFVGAVLLIVSLISKYQFKQIWIFFIYSVAGSMLRYIEKDALAWSEKLFQNEKNKKVSIAISVIVYHVLNLGLLSLLIYFLVKNYP